MAVSQQVADLLAQVAKNTSLEQSAALGIKALSAQISDLASQVAALQAQIAAGGAPLGADDINALATAVTELQGSATQLQADIPANTVENQGQSSPVATPAPAAPTT